MTVESFERTESGFISESSGLSPRSTYTRFSNFIISEISVRPHPERQRSSYLSRSEYLIVMPSRSYIALKAASKTLSLKVTTGSGSSVGISVGGGVSVASSVGPTVGSGTTVASAVRDGSGVKVSSGEGDKYGSSEAGSSVIPSVGISEG